jgi:RimJ/RimL family protein N-acetyltransferase
VEFRTLSSQDVETVRKWREQVPFALRTPRSLTFEQQQDFYKNVICNRNANAYYWGIWHEDTLIGQAGIEGIEWTNRRGEISIILNPELHQKGLGSQAFNILLAKGFRELNLDNIWGECYQVNPAIEFWLNMIHLHNGSYTRIYNTKYFDGVYYNSLWFNFSREELQ